MAPAAADAAGLADAADLADLADAAAKAARAAAVKVVVKGAARTDRAARLAVSRDRVGRAAHAVRGRRNKGCSLRAAGYGDFRLQVR